MNPIRLALHNAARHYAKAAERSFSAANLAYAAAMKHAANGEQLERVLRKIDYNNHSAAYRIRLHKANRCRNMMADKIDVRVNTPVDARTAETQKMKCVQ